MTSLSFTEAWAHQKDAVPHLLAGNYMLAWEPGVGKTLPLLQAASERGGRTLYLGPPAIRTQVAREAVVYGLFDPKKIQVIQSGKDKVAPQADLVVCSYEHSVNPAIWKQLFGLSWRQMVFDEAHMLKNPTAKRTRAVYGVRINSPGALFKRAERVWLATGTPLVNDPMDLWMHMSRLFPEVLEELQISSKNTWMERFCHVRQTPYGPQVLGGKNLDQLKECLAPHVSRIKKANVLDLPPLHVTQQWVPATDIDLDGVPEEALEELTALLKKGVENFEKLSTPLATLRRRIGLAKAAHCADIIINEYYGSQSKFLVFYQHTEVMQILAECLETQLKQKPVVYSGGLSTGKRDAVVKSFNTDPKCRIMLAQIQAAGTGLNLQSADRVLLVEPAWTPALNEQAISRAYRAGQKKKVWASMICLENSLDESITSALLRKTRIIEGAIG
jgi:SWI/SNF-related matrix-associated actin-dependent regulator of chromatin subfamily A-like protein 1